MFVAIASDPEVAESCVAAESPNLSDDSETLFENDRWWIALTAGDLPSVKALCELYPDWLAKTDEQGHTALHLASQHANKSELLDFLMDKGAAIEALDEKDNTPLLLAAKAGNLLAAQHLVARGANLEAKNANEDNAIHLAQRSHCPALVGYLYAQGLTFGQNGQHPAPSLLVAAASGDLDKVKAILLVPGTDLHAQNADGDTALHLAARFGQNAELVAFLILQGISVEAKGYHQRTPIIAAAGGGHLAIVQMLKLKFNADLEVVDENGITPLYLAACYGHLRAAEKLLEWDANVNQPDKYGMSPLSVAAENDRRKMVKLLLKFDACTDQPDEDGMTPLGVAAWAGHTSVVNRLLKAKADVNWQDNDGKTALRMAVYEGHLAVARCLLQQKADMHLTANDRHSALSVARFFKNRTMEMLLLASSGEIYRQDDQKDERQENSTPENSADNLVVRTSADVVSSLLVQQGLFRVAPTEVDDETLDAPVIAKNNCCVIL